MQMSVVCFFYILQNCGADDATAYCVGLCSEASLFLCVCCCTSLLLACSDFLSVYCESIWHQKIYASPSEMRMTQDWYIFHAFKLCCRFNVAVQYTGRKKKNSLKGKCCFQRVSSMQRPRCYLRGHKYTVQYTSKKHHRFYFSPYITGLNGQIILNRHT